MKEIHETFSEEEASIKTMTSLGKIGYIIMSPVKALEGIKQKPTVLMPMILLPVFMVLYYVLFWTSYEVQIIQLMEMQYQSMGMELTREVLEKILVLLRWSTPILGVVGLYFGALLGGFIYFAVGRLMKKSVAFKQSFSMVLHVSFVANLIWVVHMVTTVVLGESNILAPITSVASLLPGEMAGGTIAYMLINVDIINIWYLCLLYLGLNSVCNYSEKAAGIMVGLTFLLKVLMTAGSSLMSGI